jgi:hypothetical protein
MDKSLGAWGTGSGEDGSCEIGFKLIVELGLVIDVGALVGFALVVELGLGTDSGLATGPGLATNSGLAIRFGLRIEFGLIMELGLTIEFGLATLDTGVEGNGRAPIGALRIEPRNNVGGVALRACPAPNSAISSEAGEGWA